MATTLTSLQKHFSGNPDLFDSFSRFLAGCERVDLDRFLEEVDGSDYSIQDWADAFLGFEDWLAVKQIKKKDFIDMLGYFSCCQMLIAEGVERPNLRLFVYQCLTDHGFDAAE